MNLPADKEVELISDGDGLVILGEEAAVAEFCEQMGLCQAPGARDLTAALRAGASLAGAGSELAANSSRWVQLTPESAKAIRQFGLIDTNTPGVKHAMIGRRGEVRQWLQIVDRPRTMLTNPAVLAGAAGIMAQIAMQQQMDAIKDQLAVIEEKIDDLRKFQENQVIASLDTVAQNLAEAMAIRDRVGRVSEINWNKIQSSSDKIRDARNLALRQLGDLASKVEQKRKVGDLKDAAEGVAAETGKWLWVLGRSFELQNAFRILELDRVMDSTPEELDGHLLGLLESRRGHLDEVFQRTGELLARMEAAVGTANSKVLFHPVASPAVIEARDIVARDVDSFHELVGIETTGESVSARRWRDAAGEHVGAVKDAGIGGVEAAKRIGVGAARKAKSTGSRAKTKATKASAGLGDRVRRGRGRDSDGDPGSLR